MAINPSTNGTMSGRITAPDADYTYGSAKDESGAGAGDGTPYFKARADDLFGMQQALLRLASIVPTGDAETQLASQYVQGMLELAAGRAINYDESGVANVYVADVRTNQQAPAAYFEGLVVQFTAGNTNTGAATVDVDSLGVVDIKLPGGVTNPSAGQLPSGRVTKLVYRTSPGAHFELDTAGMITTSVITGSGAYNPPVGVKTLEFTVVGGGGGGGGVDGAAGQAEGGGGGAAGTSVKTTTNIESSYTITIGAGGAGGAAGDNDGTDGNDTTIVSAGVNVTAGGGGGGGGMTSPGGSNATAIGGNGGTPTGGDINIDGDDGDPGRIISGTRVVAGAGGGSFHGGRRTNDGTSAVGQNGNGRGSGGSGAARASAGANLTGGSGVTGTVSIREFF